MPSRRGLWRNWRKFLKRSKSRKEICWNKAVLLERLGSIMGKKISRNDPCPCGSGKKYKKCCLGKADNPVFSDIANLPTVYKTFRKASRIKECIYPDHTCCSEKIISAHSIQNNKILAKISDNGKVYMPVMKPEISFSLQKEYGRKEASVFTGFCGYHDKTVFQPIEDHDFMGTEEQIFLYVYRAFALEYHKKQEAVKMEQQFFSNKPSIISMPGYMIDGKTGFTMAVDDFREEKSAFDDALLTKHYDVLTSIVWYFDGFSNFAATGGEAPSLDFDSNQIQDLLNPHIPVRHIYYSVFPENNKTIAIISWLKIYDDIFSSIKERLNKATDIEKRNYINNTLPMIAENIAIKPSSWEAMSEKAQEEFSMIFYGLADFIELDGLKFNRFQAPSYDMFLL